MYEKKIIDGREILIRVSDKACIPKDFDNVDYCEYIKWLIMEDKDGQKKTN
jgi:hypothetical protein